MNTKNVILGLAAIVFAVGSAFSTAVLPNVYAKIQRTSTSNPFIPELVATTTTCVASGPAFCQVEVWIDSPVRTNKFVNAYSDVNATVALKAATAILITTYDPTTGAVITDASN
jgi:hypothetical protein